jgi:hypothetical protein
MFYILGAVEEQIGIVSLAGDWEYMILNFFA